MKRLKLAIDLAAAALTHLDDAADQRQALPIILPLQQYIEAFADECRRQVLPPSAAQIERPDDRDHAPERGHEVKPEQYLFAEALNEADRTKTYTQRSESEPGCFITLFSAADSAAILRGETFNSFTRQMVLVAAGNWLGRQAVAASEDAGRLLVTHR